MYSAASLSTGTLCRANQSEPSGPQLARFAPVPRGDHRRGSQPACSSSRSMASRPWPTVVP